MTVRQNLGYGLRVRGIPKEARAEAIERVARVLEIDHLLDRRPAQLSGGQRQRVALGRAMVRSPDIFLMDEPLSNLDARLRIAMRAELRRFHLDLNATTIYVTHDQLEAMTMSDYIAVLNGGIVQQFGTPADVYAAPADLFVAGFIGNPPMNLLPCRVALRNGSLLAISDDIEIEIAHFRGQVIPEQEVVLGIRRQDLALTTETGASTASGRVWVVELVGSEKLVDVDFGNKRRLIVQTRADALVREEDAVRLRIPPERVHLFDSQTGHRIASDSSSPGGESDRPTV